MMLPSSCMAITARSLRLEPVRETTAASHAAMIVGRWEVEREGGREERS